MEEGRDLSLEGGRSKTIEDTNGDGPPGVLADIGGAESVGLSLRAGLMRPVTEHSATDPEIAVRLQEVLVQHDGGQGEKQDDRNQARQDGEHDGGGSVPSCDSRLQDGKPIFPAFDERTAG